MKMIALAGQYETHARATRMESAAAVTLAHVYVITRKDNPEFRFKNADLRKYLDLYMRGSGGVDAVERVKLMKLLWDAVGTEFGGRHELYEINYSGSHEEIRRYALFGALASGQYDRWKQFAESCMAEYDVDGWKAKDLINVGGLEVPR